MSVSDPKFYDQMSLTRAIAEEAMGEMFFMQYKDFGEVEGYQDWYYTVRPGTTLNTDNQVFIERAGRFVSVDEYGDVRVYSKPDDPITRLLCCIIADAKRVIESEQEVPYLEAENYLDYADQNVRMAI